MSDLGRYRRVYLRLWHHPGFAGLDERGKLMALYLLTGPQTNRLGIYVLSVAAAAEDLGMTPTVAKKVLATVCAAFGWAFDGKVVHIPSWFRWNPPENANVVKGSLKDINEVPPSSLIDAFARNVGTVPKALRPTFLEGLRERFGERLLDGLPNQDQEQETGAVAGTGRQEDAPSPSAPARSARVLPEPHKDPDAVPMDVCARELVDLYPAQARCAWHLVERPLFAALTGLMSDASLSPVAAWEALKANLAKHKRSHQWRVKGMIPRLDKWLREGLYLQELPEHPVSTLVSEKTAQSASSAAAFIQGGSDGSH